MSTFSVALGIGPNSILSPFTDRSKALNPSIRRTELGYLSNHGFCTRGRLGVARFGLGQVPFPDPDGAEGVIRDLFGRAEMLLYTVADAAVSASSDALADTTTTTKQSDWLSGITNGMETVLKVLKGGLSALHVPYSYGFAIILLTFLVKAATFPLTKKQVESAMAMRSLAPQIKAIQERYAGDQERIQLETARLYKLAGINPLAGCLPTLATIPIWIGLYRALSNVADEGLLTEGFFWIPSLSGPTTIAARQTGSGISWLFQFVDGRPPLGWNDTFAYLVLPVLLVITQYISVQIMQPPQSNDPNLKTSQAITKFLPLMIGYFALSVPSGLSLYWLTNNILSTAQQIYLQKLGGADNPVKQFNDDIVKKELSQIQKSISEATIRTGMDRGEKLTSETKVDRGEKLTSEGLRPGERFKQLKEEEARRRRQLEEEKRKAEEGKVELNNGEQSNEVNLVEEPRNGINDSVNKSNPSSYEHHAVNGATSSSRAQEHVKIADHSSSYENDRIDKEPSGMTDKDEEVTANVGRDDKYSGKVEKREVD